MSCGRGFFGFLVKLITFLSFLLAVLAAISCCLTLVSILKTPGKNPYNFLVTSPEEIKNELIDVTKQEFDTSGKINNAKNENDDPNWKKHILPKFKNIYGEYRHVATGCLITGIIISLVQVMSALTILCSCSKEITSKLKIWMLVNLIIFLIFLIIFLVPLTYSFKDGRRLGASEINDNLRTHLDKMRQLVSVHEKAFHELNLYFSVIGINGIFLFLSIFILSTLVYCMKCGTENYQPIS